MPGGFFCSVCLGKGLATRAQRGAAARSQPSPMGEGKTELSSHALEDCPRRFADMEFGGAVPAQPDHHPRRIYPIKGCDLFRHFHGCLNRQPLYGLDIKHAVINFAVAAVIAMHAFALKKELLHGGYPSLAPHRAS